MVESDLESKENFDDNENHAIDVPKYLSLSIDFDTLMKIQIEVYKVLYNQIVDVFSEFNEMMLRDTSNIEIKEYQIWVYIYAR
jgi:hypothetical protein